MTSTPKHFFRKLSCLITIFLILSSVAFVTIQPASATTYNYFLTKTGSFYNALDSERNPMYSSISSSYTFNYLLGSNGVAPAGSNINIESGNYIVNSVWEIYKDNVYLHFEDGAVLTAANSLNFIMLWVHSNGVIIDNAELDGNALNQQLNWANWDGFVHAHGIVVSGSNAIIKNSEIYNCRIYGVLLLGSNSGIQDSKVYNIGWNGIHVWGASATDNFITNNNVSKCGDLGIGSYGVNTIITKNNIYDITPNGANIGANQGIGLPPPSIGIAIEDDDGAVAGGTGNGKYLTISDNTISNAKTGISVSSWGGALINYVKIINNILTNCDKGYMGAILVDSSHSIIESNSITTANIGIRIKAYSSVQNIGNTIGGNAFSNDVTTPIADGGTNTIYSNPSPTATPNPILTPTPLPQPEATGARSIIPTPSPTSTVSPTPIIPTNEGSLTNITILILALAIVYILTIRRKKRRKQSNWW